MTIVGSFKEKRRLKIRKKPTYYSAAVIATKEGITSKIVISHSHHRHFLENFNRTLAKIPSGKFKMFV